MTKTRTARQILGSLLAGAALLTAGPALAQVTPAAGYTPPDDTPTIKVGVTLFTDYIYTDEPVAKDADGNTINPAAFNVSRAYINVTGNISHNVSFRVTPDVSRLTTSTTTTSVLGPGETVTTTAATSLDGSLTYRLKYAYGQFNLDDRWTKGSWVRLGVHHTPYVDWEEGIYRYRFQGQILMERDGFISSSDFGISTHYNLPGNFGDIHGGYYNGDTYSKAEPNDQKAIQIRGTLRPLPGQAVLKGLKLTAFYDADNYIQGDARRRFIYALTFEHKYLNAGFEHLDATDQATGAAAEVKADGYSLWATPRSPKGWEGLLRYDNLKPNKNVDATKTRKIAGIAYWFHSLQAPATAAILLDYENVTYDTALAKPDEKRYAAHALFNF
ncbi:MAG TPA: hypothetical protein VFT43_03735 [Candidatus Polarisedimenticolia bacterium]|nr:hypothetical protein [Candidatus Polarisedimenticolia bacterium]